MGLECRHFRSMISFPPAKGVIVGGRVNHGRINVKSRRSCSRWKNEVEKVDGGGGPVGLSPACPAWKIGREGKDVSRGHFYFRRLSSARQMTWKETFDLEKNLRPFSLPFLFSFTLSFISFHDSLFSLYFSLDLFISLSRSRSPLRSMRRIFLPRNVTMNAGIIPLAFEGNVKALIKLIRSVSALRYGSKEAYARM